MSCPCGSGIALDACCGRYVNAGADAPTPEALMRSRYTAFVLHQVDYLVKTMRGEPLKTFNPADTLTWLQEVTWVGLTVINTKQKTPTLGYVSFDAQYQCRGALSHICEKSEFHRIDHQWFYVGGKALNPTGLSRGPS